MEIYLDNAATTKVHEDIAKEVQKIFLEDYANPSSQHSLGNKARNILEESRKKIAGYCGCEPEEIVFTSGGTESNNLAIKGIVKANSNKNHIITSTIEHPSVLAVCKDLEQQGYKVTYIKPNNNGIINPNEIKDSIKENTVLVSIMHVNNEIGTIQPIEEIAKICKQKNVYFHTDWVQGFTKEKLNLENINLASVSGHKFHTPKGIGFLYIKKGTKIFPITFGGGQEKNVRSGTHNLPGIVGMAKAIEIKISKEGIKNSRDKILKELLKIPGTRLNGSKEKRIYNNINISFYGIEGESLMLLLDKEGIFVSTGSACASNKLAESYVLRSLDVDDLYIHGSIRLTFGEDAIGNEEYIIDKIKNSVEKLREISPFKLELNSGGENER